MNTNDELPPDHVRDSQEAKQEYHAIGQAKALQDAALQAARVRSLIPAGAQGVAGYASGNTLQTSGAHSTVLGSEVVYDPETDQYIHTGGQVSIAASARNRGLYCIGKTGTGKTSFFLNLMLDLSRAGLGFCFVDPVGQATRDLIARLPEDRIKDVLLLDILHPTYTFGLHLYECTDGSDREVSRAHERVMRISKRLWGDKEQNYELGPWVREYLSASAYTIMDNNLRGVPATMAEVPLLFHDPAVRRSLTRQMTDQEHRLWWEHFNSLRPDEQERRAMAAVGRLSEFIRGNRYAKQIVGQTRSTINFREVMDSGKILLVRLSNEDKELSRLAGAVIINLLLEAALSRSDLLERGETPRQFSIVADEYHEYATADFGELVEQARKMFISTVFGHQARYQLDFATKEGALQTVNSVWLRVSGKDAEEGAREFNNTPVRTKKVLKQRTKPVFKEWDETVWIENGQEQYEEVLARLDAEYETERLRLTTLLSQAQKKEREQQAPLKIAREAESVFRASAYLKDWYCPAWGSKDYDSERIIAKSFYTKTRVRPSPFKYEWEKEKCAAIGEGWTDQMVERTIGKLVEVKERVLEGSFEFRYTGRTFILFGDNMTKWVHVTYDYLERDEHYELAETTPITVQVSFQEGIKKASQEAQEILREPYTELTKIIPAVRNLGIWFHPALVPSPIEDLSGRSEQLHVSWPDHVFRAWGNGIITNDVVSMMTNRQVLDHYSQPQIGQKRTVPGWVQHGFWHMQEHSRLTAWRQKWGHILDSLCGQRQEQLSSCSERVGVLKRQLSALQPQYQELGPKIKANFQRIEHHKVYLGEQPDTQQQTRVSHSFSSGTSIRPNFGRFGPDYIEGTSSSRSTSYSTVDVQWYDLVDELDQTPDERQAEIANELRRLPDFLARCILQEGDRPVERTVRIPRLLPGVTASELDRRIRVIEQQTVQAGCYRVREEVKKEIDYRQRLLRNRAAGEKEAPERSSAGSLSGGEPVPEEEEQGKRPRRPRFGPVESGGQR